MTTNMKADSCTDRAVPSTEYYTGMAHGEQIIASQVEKWARDGYDLDEILGILREAGLI